MQSVGGGQHVFATKGGHLGGAGIGMGRTDADPEGMFDLLERSALLLQRPLDLDLADADMREFSVPQEVRAADAGVGELGVEFVLVAFIDR